MRPYVRAANVTWDGISLHDVKKMDFTPAEFETYALRPGDLLLSEASGSPSEVGKPAIWTGQVPDCCFQNTLIRVRLHDSSLAPFLHLHFYKDALTGRFADASRGVGIHHLGARTLSEWPIHLPPPAEQRRIVETVRRYFRRIDEVVGVLERVRRNLRRYRASVLQAAAAGRLAPTEADLARAEGRGYEPASVLLGRILAERRRRWEEAELAKTAAKGKAPKDGWRAKYREPAAPDTAGLPALPEGWRWVRLDAVADVDLGQQRHPGHAAGPGQVPYLRAANITWAGLDLRDVKTMAFPNPDRFVLKTGDVLLSEASGSPMEAGKPAIWRDEIPGACFQNTVLRVRPLDRNLLTPEFLRAVFLHDCLDGRFARLAPGVGIVHISARRLSAWRIPLPPTVEQHRIVAALTELESHIGGQERNVARALNTLTSLRQAILVLAFAGKLMTD